MSLERVVLVKPRGFCAGVVRAVEIVEMALQATSKPVYVRKEIVHNPHVVNDLKARGAIFVEELDEVPAGAIAIFSAHGVSPEVREQATEKKLRVIDATCPLVTKVHLEAVRYAEKGYSIILIGHKGHDEVIGTMGEAPASIHLVSSVEEVEQLEVANPDKVAYLTQTTLSVDDTIEIVEALRRKFPQLDNPPKDDICYATQNRQSAVKDLAQHVDLILVIGAQNSSNSQRLKEVALQSGVPSYLVADYTDVQPEWLAAVRSVGVTAGASAPEQLVRDLVDFLRNQGAGVVEELEPIHEGVRFSLPPELKELSAS